MKYISTIEDFNNVKNHAARSLGSKLVQYENKLIWGVNQKDIYAKKNVKPLLCFDREKGQFFKTVFEAKFYVARKLRQLNCYDSSVKYPGLHWQINLPDRHYKNTAFSLYVHHHIQERTLYIKFNLSEQFDYKMNTKFYFFNVLSFHPSLGRNAGISRKKL